MPSRAAINWDRVDNLAPIASGGLALFALLDHDWNASLAWTLVCVYQCGRVAARGRSKDTG